MIEIRRRIGKAGEVEVDTGIDDVWLLDDLAYPQGARVGFLAADGPSPYFCERFVSERVFADVVVAITERDGELIRRKVIYLPGADNGVEKQRLVSRIGNAAVPDGNHSGIRGRADSKPKRRRTSEDRDGGCEG